MAEESDSKKKKEEALNLIDETKKKPSRRERQREEASKKKTVADQKSEALDLGIEDDAPKKSAVRKTEKSGTELKPTISKLQDEAADPEFVSSSTPVSKDPVEEKEEPDAVVDGNVISIKPPIIVSVLAEKMDLKPFEIMKDLIGLEVFVAPHQAIEPDIAEQVCEKHGFVFERESGRLAQTTHHTRQAHLRQLPHPDTLHHGLEAPPACGDGRPSKWPCFHTLTLL